MKSMKIVWFFEEKLELPIFIDYLILSFEFCILPRTHRCNDLLSLKPVMYIERKTSKNAS